MATDGRDAAAGDTGNLGVGQLLEMAQDDRYALRWRQRGDGVSDGIDGKVTFRGLDGLVIGVRDVTEQVKRVGDPGPADPVQRLAGDDPVQPGGETRVCLESRQLLPSRNERFLGNVLGVMVVAEQPQRNPVRQPAVTVNELGVGVEVALLGALDEVGVIDVRFPPSLPRLNGVLLPGPPGGPLPCPGTGK